jgi:hypothetical protein
MRSVPGRNRTTHSTEMAKASGQDRVEHDSGPAVLPRNGAVPPPCQRSRHGGASPPIDLELIRQWTPSEPMDCRWTFASSSRCSLPRGNRYEGSRITLVSLLSPWKFSSRSDHHHRSAGTAGQAPGSTGGRVLGQPV